MYNFEYHRPASLEEAASALSSGDDPKIVAGGMTLVPTLKQRLAMPSDLVDLGAGRVDVVAVATLVTQQRLGHDRTSRVVGAHEDDADEIPVRHDDSWVAVSD